MAAQNLKVFGLILAVEVIFFIVISHKNDQGGENGRVLLGKELSKSAGRLFNGFIPRMEQLNRQPGLPTQTGKIDETNIYSLRHALPRRTAAGTPIPIMNKSSFSKLPRWAFDDVYNFDAPPRPTTCAKSLRHSKDKTFQRNFLPNIRMFLHKENFNITEWNRLSHFNSPFGYMEMKYDDILPVVKLIEKPKEPLLLPKAGGDGCVRCAVVGTAGIMNGSKTGAEIDAHDYGIKYVLIPEGLRDFQWLQGLLKGENVSSGEYLDHEPRGYYSGQFNESHFYVLHQDFLRYVRNRFLNSSNLNGEHWALVRPTNGAFTLFLALHTCDTVSAYGFMTDDYNKYSSYYVEKHLRSEVIFYINHDLILEKNLWKSFHDKKIMKLYQRTG
ncbi:PREDICTED: alpha-N-acetylgalactosaminide alpha-2,6-sialyltransferase 1-like [Cyprinodon variegatus]|uniref:alpha-N-acetylgalactosaminide alpha-2,6-sialyltransferase 1-like n=1 Tax=Cyprinodon variegatus TaxID=28743 RepID=UPI000742835F|nr:PREDICTED: alpha-N-acetylgalactosaminide alpha-2,6-sialyltransferase 1-like [Cyprinodon variegatus]